MQDRLRQNDGLWTMQLNGTPTMRVRWSWVVLAGSLICLGCSTRPYELAPVSGIVTLDGQPLEAARVRFEPRSSGDAVNVGPGSIGVTDSAGRFQLETIRQEAGAVVGSHVVRIGTRQTRLDPENLDRLEVLAEEVVPIQFNTNTTLRFEVPPGGTEEAHFDLTTDGPRAS